MATTSPTPFGFDRDFLSRTGTDHDIVPMPKHKAAVAEAEAQGMKRGEEEGRAKAMASETARLAASVERLISLLYTELSASEARAQEAEESAVRLALILARKLAGDALERYPLAALEGAAKMCFAEARQAPHVAVRVHDSQVEAVKERLLPLAQEKGFGGKLIVLGDPDIPPGDGKLEWADGGVSRDQAAIEAAIEKAMGQYMTSAPPNNDEESLA